MGPPFMGDLIVRRCICMVLSNRDRAAPVSEVRRQLLGHLKWPMYGFWPMFWPIHVSGFPGVKL